DRLAQRAGDKASIGRGGISVENPVIPRGTAGAPLAYGRSEVWIGFIHDLPGGRNELRHCLPSFMATRRTDFPICADPRTPIFFNSVVSPKPLLPHGSDWPIPARALSDHFPLLRIPRRREGYRISPFWAL